MRVMGPLRPPRDVMMGLAFGTRDLTHNSLLNSLAALIFLTGSLTQCVTSLKLQVKLRKS